MNETKKEYVDMVDGVNDFMWNQAYVAVHNESKKVVIVFITDRFRESHMPFMACQSLLWDQHRGFSKINLGEVRRDYHIKERLSDAKKEHLWSSIVGLT